MSAIVANPIEISLPPPSLTKFERERAAFERLLPSLLNTYRGQYVAIHNGQVAGQGSNRLDVALRVLKQVGSVDIYVGLVSEQPEAPCRSGVRRTLGQVETVG